MSKKHPNKISDSERGRAGAGGCGWLGSASQSARCLMYVSATGFLRGLSDDFVPVPVGKWVRLLRRASLLLLLGEAPLPRHPLFAVRVLGQLSTSCVCVGARLHRRRHLGPVLPRQCAFMVGAPAITVRDLVTHDERTRPAGLLEGGAVGDEDVQTTALLLALGVSLSAVSAHAGGPTYYLAPPARYDHPYKGDLTVMGVGDQASVRRMCYDVRARGRRGRLLAPTLGRVARTSFFARARVRATEPSLPALRFHAAARSFLDKRGDGCVSQGDGPHSGSGADQH